MADYIQEGKSINYKNSSESETIKYGEVVVLTDRIGIAAADIPPGMVGALMLSGCYEEEAESTAAFAVGQQLYWNHTSKKLTASADGGSGVTYVKVGFATDPKVLAGTRARFKIGG